MSFYKEKLLFLIFEQDFFGLFLKFWLKNNVKFQKKIPNLEEKLGKLFYRKEMVNNYFSYEWATL